MGCTRRLQAIVADRKKLSGREFRFLRTELLMSQATLARMLGVTELTVARWEKGHAKLPQMADATLRMLYLEHIGGKCTETLLSVSIASPQALFIVFCQQSIGLLQHN